MSRNDQGVGGQMTAGLSAVDGRSGRHGQVPHLGDASDGVPDAVAFTAAVAQDVVGLHVGQGVLHPDGPRPAQACGTPASTSP